MKNKEYHKKLTKWERRRKKLWLLHTQKGMSYRQIADKEKITYTTVRDLIKKYEANISRTAAVSGSE